MIRGHFIPIDPNTSTAATSGGYDVGSEDHYWRKFNGMGVSFVELATSTSIATPGTGFLTLYAKNNSTLYIKDDAGVETEVGSGGGGGGTAIKWEEGSDAPLFAFENEIGIYAFGQSLGQDLYSVIKVPNSYQPGTQLNLRMTYYSGDTTGTTLIQSVSTLIRTGTDPITSTTNQRTSTNVEVTLGAGTVNEPQAVAMDLTDSNGLINAVTVTAGDILKVRLTRGTDTSTMDIKVPVYGAEVS